MTGSFPLAANKRDLVYGLHAVRAALEKSHILQLWCDRERRDARMDELRQLADQAGIEIFDLSHNELNALLPEVRHQGVIASLHPPKVHGERDLEELLQNLTHPPFLLVLDGIKDPHNLGACLRTADAVGVDAVIAPKDRAVGLTATVRKVACGAAQTVPFIRVTNLARTLRYLRSSGIWLIGSAGETDQELYQTELIGPLAVVMGAEGRGLRRLTRQNCDLLVRIPMSGMVESLNVSVATAVCLYEALRQRQTG